jgi:hypothetical protein
MAISAAEWPGVHPGAHQTARLYIAEVVPLDKIPEIDLKPYKIKNDSWKLMDGPKKS